MLDPAGYRQRIAAASSSGDVFGPDYAWKLAGTVLELGAAVCLVKLGAGGMVVRYSRDSARLKDTGLLNLGNRLPAVGTGRYVPAFVADSVVSATGAGDSAIAGVLAALLHGESLLDAVDVGCIAGRNAVATVDAVSAAETLPTMIAQREVARKRREQQVSDGQVSLSGGWQPAQEPGLFAVDQDV